MSCFAGRFYALSESFQIVAQANMRVRGCGDIAAIEYSGNISGVKTFRGSMGVRVANLEGGRKDFHAVSQVAFKFVDGIACYAEGAEQFGQRGKQSCHVNSRQ